MPDGSVHRFPGIRNNCYYDDASAAPLVYPNVLIGDTDTEDLLWMRLDLSVSPHVIYAPNGTRWGSSFEDANGNMISVGAPSQNSGGPSSYTDSVGRIIQLSYQPPSSGPPSSTYPGGIVYKDS